MDSDDLGAKLIGAISILFTAACTLIAHKQAGFWKDNVTLWSHAVEVTSENYRAEGSLGDALWAQKDAKNAVFHLSEALRIEPRYAEAHNKLGVVLEEQGRISEAAAHYLQALRLNPSLSEALNNLGYIAASFGHSPSILLTAWTTRTPLRL